MKIFSYNPDPFLYNGYYLYDGNIHTDRHTIADEIVSDKIKYNEYMKEDKVSFYFHDDYFSQFDWTKEPQQSLKELYKQRAIQLRDKYDYLILSYSGGSDSHQALETFLNNNIFIDEIFISTWEKLLHKIDRSELLSDEHLRFFMEYELNVLPMLKKIKEKSPATNISTIDTSDFLYNDVNSGRFEILGMLKTNGGGLRGLMIPIPMTIKMFAGYYMNKVEKKNAAFIVGIEKPILSINDDRVYFNFSDDGYTYDKLINNRLIDRVCNIEYFYWSPDAPYIPIKQAHVVKRELENDKIFYGQFTNTKILSIDHDLNKKRGHNQWYDFEKILMTKIYHDLNSLNYFPGKPKLISPELNLLSKYYDLGNKITGAYKESYTYRLKKYNNLKVDILKKIICTKKYLLGKFEPRWLM